MKCRQRVHARVPRCAKAGFTLIELLVVMAIIAILASILIPALNVAREKAQQANCISNLKQIGTAVYLYTDSFDDHLVSTVYGPGNDDRAPCTPIAETVTYPIYKDTWEYNWMFVLVEWQCITKSEKVFQCAGSYRDPWSRQIFFRQYDWGPYKEVNYEPTATNCTGGAHYWAYGWSYFWNRYINQFTMLNRIPMPSEIIVSGDANPSPASNITWYVFIDNGYYLDRNTGLYHPGQNCNTVMVDGHVRQFNNRSEMKAYVIPY